jgi:hypothetical protein
MTSATATQTLTQVEFEEHDFAKAEKIAKALGYEQTAYTSTSALWGLFCAPENPATVRNGEPTTGGCIIKTKELGFLFVQDGEDLHRGYDWCNVESMEVCASCGAVAPWVTPSGRCNECGDVFEAEDAD